jgi:DNA-binding MarR family transcriptional regulator
MTYHSLYHYDRREMLNQQWAERQTNRIYDLLPATMDELTAKTGYKKNTLTRILKQLRKEHKIITVGHKKPTYERK